MNVTGGFRQHRQVFVLALAKAGAVAGLSLALLLPAGAQFWGQWDARQPRQQQRQPQQQQPQQQQQEFNPFGGWFGAPQNRPRRDQQRDSAPDYSRAPSAQRKGEGAAIPIVVMGDGMADWLAYGLEDAFAEKPEITIIRRQRGAAGLIRYDPKRDNIEWPQVVRESIASDRPKFILMMIGVNDRQSIRERAPGPAAGGAAAKPAPGAKPGSAPATVDPELQAQQSADQQNAALQEEEDRPGSSDRASAGTFEFHSEKWQAAYIKRIDATIAAMKSTGVPIIWVGLPPQRATRASTDSAYLNELYRASAEKAGITYVDIWDGFVDEAGRFAPQGPDYQGQTRQLRASDGVYFTKPGARKLAHYVEREIERHLANRAVPVALPTAEPERSPAGAARPGANNATNNSAGAGRPLAGPVVPLTLSANAAADGLVGAAATPSKPSIVDPIAVRVLTKGEPLPAPAGRADDFGWPRSAQVVPEPVTRPAPPPTAAPAPAQSRTTPARKGGAQTQAPATTAPPTSTPPTAPAAAAAANAQDRESSPPPKRRRPKTASTPRPSVGLGVSPLSER